MLRFTAVAIAAVYAIALLPLPHWPAGFVGGALAASEGQSGQVARVIAGANVRAAPQGEIVGALAAGTVVPVVGCEWAWCRVALPGGGDAWIHVSLIEIDPASGNGTSPPAPPEAPVVSPAADDACGIPVGGATVVIAEAGMEWLNVRDRPGGLILGAVPNGSNVSVVGECRTVNAEGVETARRGWCRIDTPVAGCVSARYIAATAPPVADADAAEETALADVADGEGSETVAPDIDEVIVSDDLEGTATEIVEETLPDVVEPVAPAVFAGAWATQVDGVAYAVTLTQDGEAVGGAWRAEDGSAGEMEGAISGTELRFSWTRADGLSGTGRFVLSKDGHSFRGSYAFADDPEEADGIWTGVRH